MTPRLYVISDPDCNLRGPFPSADAAREYARSTWPDEPEAVNAFDGGWFVERVWAPGEDIDDESPPTTSGEVR